MQLVSVSSYHLAENVANDTETIALSFHWSAWIEESNIKNYSEFKDQLIKSSKSAAFKEAVQKIDEFISDPVVSTSCVVLVQTV